MLVRIVLLATMAASMFASISPLVSQTHSKQNHSNEVLRFKPIEAQYMAELDQ